MHPSHLADSEQSPDHGIAGPPPSMRANLLRMVLQAACERSA